MVIDDGERLDVPASELLPKLSFRYVHLYHAKCPKIQAANLIQVIKITKFHTTSWSGIALVVSYILYLCATKQTKLLHHL